MNPHARFTLWLLAIALGVFLGLLFAGGWR